MSPKEVQTRRAQPGEGRGRRQVAEKYLEVAGLIDSEDGKAINGFGLLTPSQRKSALRCATALVAQCPPPSALARRGRSRCTDISEEVAAASLHSSTRRRSGPSHFDDLLPMQSTWVRYTMPSNNYSTWSAS